MQMLKNAKIWFYCMCWTEMKVPQELPLLESRATSQLLAMSHPLEDSDNLPQLQRLQILILQTKNFP